MMLFVYRRGSSPVKDETSEDKDQRDSPRNEKGDKWVCTHMGFQFASHSFPYPASAK